MTTLADFIEQVRTDLADLDEAAWTDAALEQHLRQALAAVSQAMPRQVKTTLTFAGNTRDLDVSGLAGRIGVEALEYPAGRFPVSYAPFSAWGDALTLLLDGPPSAGAPAVVYWTAGHTLTSDACSLPPWAEPMLVLGATAFAALEQASAATNRVTTGGDSTVDHYLGWGRERMSQFQQALGQQRRRRGLLPRRLYTPVAAAASQAAVRGA